MRQTMNLHIGNLIRAELYAQRRSVAWLAKEIHCNRSNAYKILDRANVDVELLGRISIVLQHNFFDDIAKNMQDVVH